MMTELNTTGGDKSEYLKKYGDQRRIRIKLRVGQTKFAGGTIIIERPSTIEVTQVWTKNERSWEDDYWRITHYHLDTIQEVESEKRAPRVPWWRRLFGLGPELPEAKVIEHE